MNARAYFVSRYIIGIEAISILIDAIGFLGENMLLFLGIISFLGAVLVLLHRICTRAFQEIERRELQELVDENLTLAKREKAKHAHLKEKNQ